MQYFPLLERWFEIRRRDSTQYRYTRFDLCLREDIGNDEKEALVDEIALLIARLRLRPDEYQEWLKYWKNSKPFSEAWKPRFRHHFWKSFVSQKATNEAGGRIAFDETALQGYLGELFLYIIQYQMYKDAVIDIEPLKPKPYSKNDGIDCLEIIGVRSDENESVLEPSHYIVWEAKGLTSSQMGEYPSKIYNQHIEATPKSFGEIVDTLAHRHEDDTLTSFIDQMIDSFYVRPPSPTKSFGACVTFSNQRFARSDAFSTFYDCFRGDLADDMKCRQVRICAIGDLQEIANNVRDRIWSKLRL